MISRNKRISCANAFRVLLLSTAAGLHANATHAQADATGSVGSGGQIDQEGRLGTVTVTAQRKAETDQDTPISITALGEEALEDRGITDMAALQFAVPNVSIGQRLGATNITIRGVGRSIGDPGVALNVDGVYQPRDFPMAAAQLDLERVEVLRGPQGTLYGRNANGGVVNFITAEPTDELEGYIKLGYATFNQKTVESVTNIPLNDRVRTRLSLNYTDRDEGFVKNIAGGEDLDTIESLTGRFRLDADLTDNLTLGLNFNGFDAEGATDYYVPTDEPSSYGISLNPYLTTAEVAGSYFETTALGPTHSSRSMQAASATLDWLVGDLALKSITSYQRVDSSWTMDRDGVDLPIVDATQDERSETYSQELNISSSVGRLDWVGGLYFYDDSYTQSADYVFEIGYAPLPPNSTLSYNTLPLDTQARAVFGDLTYAFTDRFRMIGGVRYSEDEQEGYQHHFVGSTLPDTSSTITCDSVTTKLSDNSTTYRLGAQFDTTQTSQVYVMNSTGWKAGGLNHSSCADTFDAETLDAYEIGFKGLFFGGNLKFNTSAFYYDYDDFQVREVVGISASVTNAGSATVQGLEIETEWAPDDHWVLNGNLSLLDATYGDFTNVDSLNPQLGAQNLEGRYLTSAPKVSGNLGIAFHSDTHSWGDVTARADASYRSEVFFREFNTPQESQDGYTVVNANLIWNSPSGAYSARLFADNVFDEGYWTAMLAIDGFGGLAGTYGRPRQIGIELKARY
ncbi:MAG: TonB-dependent receptor [Henriciella sp.]|uniref:TonB-dependent receptor n=1 Tax=Henriciella sp. TaxID=1968823 RepID=UPI003C7891C1